MSTCIVFTAALELFHVRKYDFQILIEFISLRNIFIGRAIIKGVKINNYDCKLALRLRSASVDITNC